MFYFIKINWWKGLIVLVIFLGVFFMVELVLRRAGVPKVEVSLNEDGENIYSSNSEWHHSYFPNQIFNRVLAKEDGGGFILNSINKDGMRGELVGNKNSKSRVLLLGDSFIEADEIDYDSTIGRVLENDFLDNKMEVVQYGISSWSPLLELNWMLKKGKDFEPDYVFLFLVINDFYTSGDYEYANETVFDYDGQPVSFTVKQNDREYKPYNNSSWVKWNGYSIKKLWDNFNNIWLRGAWSKQLSQDEFNNILNNYSDRYKQELSERFRYGENMANIIELTQDQKLWGDDLRKRVDLSLSYIDKIREVVEDGGAKLVITLIPLPWNVNQEENIKGRIFYGIEEVDVPIGSIEEVIKKYAEENNIFYMDLYNVFSKYRDKKKLFLSLDGHWSSGGHYLAAEEVYNTINKINSGL